MLDLDRGMGRWRRSGGCSVYGLVVKEGENQVDSCNSWLMASRQGTIYPACTLPHSFPKLYSWSQSAQGIQGGEKRV